ncbi:MAG: ABC transporter substrate-binding protein [Bdellovibrionota bacterium]|nr:MAG: ABC transporter substrate-binding protein [Bdellovibrionota bacterium]
MRVALRSLAIALSVGMPWSSALAEGSSTSRAIRLGVTAPLTGDFASYSEIIRKGTELAKDHLKAEGIDIELIYEDACLPVQAVTAIRKLISQDRIDGLAANYCLLAMPPMASEIERHELPSFHTACTSDNILSAGDYIFSTNIKGRSEAHKLAEHAINTLKARTASILYLTTDFGEDYKRHFTQRFEELGGKVVSTATSPIGTNDFRSDLTALRAKNPDVVLAAHIGGSLGALLRQAKQLGLKQQFLAIYEAEDPSVIEAAQGSAEGLQFFVPEPVEETAVVKRFQSAYVEKYGVRPLILASNAYDATTILARTIHECNFDRSCSKAKIYALKDYDGASGRFSIDSDGGTIKGFVAKVVAHGQFVRVSRS